MGKVYFKVNTKTEDLNKDVSIRVRFKNGQVDQSTKSGEYVQLQHWDLGKQKFRRTNFKGKDQMITRLNLLKAHILDEAVNTNLFKKGWLLEVVDKKLNPEKYKLKQELSMYEWIEAWIHRSENTYHAIRPYHSTLNDMKAVNPTLEWEQIDFNFHDDFIKYLKEKKYSKNTIASRIKNLKVFCNAALKRGIHNNLTFKEFKKQTEDSFNIYLNEDELEIINDLDLTNSPYLDRARDIFLVGCWTGCRFSDLPKIKKENIQGEFIHLEQQKSENRVIIPLHPVVKSIFDKYNGTLPEMISNQKFNKYIKAVCEKAEFTDVISKGITKGGMRQTEANEKWQMVTSHTARRSFATNLFKTGFPTLGIMAITGHKTEKAFLSYIKVSSEEHAEMLMKHWNKTLQNEN